MSARSDRDKLTTQDYDNMLDARDKLILELRLQVSNLIEKNDNQAAIITQAAQDKFEFSKAIKIVLETYNIPTGWGDDDDLIELEAAAGSAMSELIEIKEKLDTIRTSR